MPRQILLLYIPASVRTWGLKKAFEKKNITKTKRISQTKRNKNCFTFNNSKGFLIIKIERFFAF